MKDHRASEIGNYLRSGCMKPDVIRIIAYNLMHLEQEGELEIFITEEIDKFINEQKRL